MVRAQWKMEHLSIRLITGNVYPLGIGFTMKPAANVKGVISEEKEQIETKEVKAIEINTKQSDQLQKVAAKISQNLKKTVNNNKIMDYRKPINRTQERSSREEILSRSYCRHDINIC